MVATSAVGVNTSDIPEASFGAQKSSRTGKHVVPKWNFAIADSIAEEHDEISGCTPDLKAMFPSLESDLVHAIVAESPTWEKALGVLLSLMDDKIDFDNRQVPIAKDPVTDHLGFPSLLDADGWEVIRGLDPNDTNHPMWCDAVRDVTNSVQSIRGSPQRHSWMLFDGLTRKDVAVAAGNDHAEVETEHECKQRRGVERRLNRAKHDRRPTNTLVRSSEVKNIAGKHDKEHKDSGPPAWRLCRFEDKL